MMIQDYQMPKEARDSVFVSSEFYDLYKDAAAGGASPAKLKIWLNALKNQALFSYFERPDWPFELLRAFPADIWCWHLSGADDKSFSGSLLEVEEVLRSSSGVDYPPLRNISLSIMLRDYASSVADVGSYEWWREQAGHVVAASDFGRIFTSCLLDCLLRALHAGSSLFVERIAIVLSKVARANLSTLSPIVHADMHYGAQEAAIGSILERGWEGFGGTLFMPTCNMSILKRFGNLKIKDLDGKLINTPIVKTGSGDIAIYDGMIKDGERRSRENGVPHISPDIPGRSARLGILMRHRRTALAGR